VPRKPRKKTLLKRLNRRHYLLAGAAFVFVFVAGAMINQTYHPLRALADVLWPSKPNIVFIMVDDLDMSLMQYMPLTKQLVADKGATFENYFDNVALCCPARASILRGQYSHNTGVLDNHWPAGGYGVFHQADEASTIATWLRAAGYHTSLTGKYMNQYPTVVEDPTKGVDPSFVPPGWSNWASPIGGHPYSEYNYKLNVNGVVDATLRQDYMTYTISDLANRFINRQTGSYFAYVTTYAPHGPYTPAPADADYLPNLTYPHKLSFNEPNVSDKPELASLPLLTTDAISKIDTNYRKRVESVQAVDRMVQRLYNTVKAKGELDKTYFVFTSDNGYHMGEHRLPTGKNTVYEEDIHLPLYISGPGITAGSHISEMVGNVDLAPTFAQLAGATAPAFVDGRSLVPLLRGLHPLDWRKYYLIERGNTESNAALTSDLEEPADDVTTVGSNPREPFAAVRSNGYLYAEYADGTKEYYDLSADPYELRNLLRSSTSESTLTGTAQTTLPTLQTALTNLRSCTGAGCQQ
jgi:N-acetylglucosamine-6-sulfatase